MYCKELLPKTLWARIRGLLGDSSSSLLLHFIFGGDRSVISLLLNCWQKLDDSHSLIFFTVICTLLVLLWALFCLSIHSTQDLYIFFLLCCMNYACISIENQPLLMTRVCLVTWQALLSEHFILKMSSIVQDSIDLFLGNYVVDTNEGISKPSPLETHRDWRFMAVSLLAVLCCNLYFFLCIEF